MQRLKHTEPAPAPRSGGNWLVGMMIGGAIMTIVTQAMVLGATTAIRNSVLKGG